MKLLIDIILCITLKNKKTNVKISCQWCVITIFLNGPRCVGLSSEFLENSQENYFVTRRFCYSPHGSEMYSNQSSCVKNSNTLASFRS